MATFLALIPLASVLFAQETDPAPELHAGIAQLRHDAGTWKVVTEFLAPAGSVRRSVEGTYTFEWVVPDRVLVGRTESPELGPGSGLLYYLKESTNTLEQVSVSAGGHLWILSGPDRDRRSRARWRGQT
ncbi:MAG: hypothetical protein ACE5GX_15795 [Thermoanaerobaculia bacterium]